jgi:hypothetical protein
MGVGVLEVHVAGVPVGVPAAQGWEDGIEAGLIIGLFVGFFWGLVACACAWSLDACAKE